MSILKTIENATITDTYDWLDASPSDDRCRFWAKRILIQDLPKPPAIDGAPSIPAPYERQGETLHIDDTVCVLTGEDRHHRKTRGWDYEAWVYDPQKKEKRQLDHSNKTVKKLFKLLGAKDYVGGAGELAHAVRSVHAWRLCQEISVSWDALPTILDRLAEKKRITVQDLQRQQGLLLLD